MSNDHPQRDPKDAVRPDDVAPAEPIQMSAAREIPPGEETASSLTSSAKPPDEGAQSSNYSTYVPPIEIPGYQILKELGRGGMGVVYHARDLALNRFVAVKMLKDVDSVTAEQLARFQVEIQTIAQLPHAHIVQIFSTGSHECRPFFAMEYVAGGTLADKLNKQPQPPRDAARMVLLLARAMYTAHRKNIIHRDLKPLNILLAPLADESALNTVYGCPKISDFGLAKNLQANQILTSAGDFLGTVKYMAPEQVEGNLQAIGAATDIYALGVILYEMLVGAPPFTGPSIEVIIRQVLLANPPRPSSMRQTIPAALEVICLRCLAKKPADRYPTAAALADALQRYLDEQPAKAHPVALAPPVDLQEALRSVEPAAVLVSARVLRNIIREAGSHSGLLGWVPHRKSFVVDRQTLFQHVEQEQLGVASDQVLPLTVILLARPKMEELTGADSQALLLKYWQRLFHCSVHLTLEKRWEQGALTETNIRERIERLGVARFEEVRTVLIQDRYLGPEPDDRSVYIEFIAVFLELELFASHLLSMYFPGISELAKVKALLREDVDAEMLYQRTRLPGAPEPAAAARTANNSQEAHEYYWKLIHNSELAMQQGNVVLAAIHRRRAARMAPTGLAYATRQDAVTRLLSLVERLRPPLLLSDAQAEQWSKHLPALLDKADQGRWPAEAALLYDLQKVCQDNEREIYALDLVEWLLSAGKRPIKRPLPGQRRVRVARTLCGATQRLTLSRLSSDDRSQFAALLDDAVKRSEDQVRERFRPLLTSALQDVGLQPHHPLEATALGKVVEEVLDRIIASGFVTFSELRDILSGSQLKLPDLSGPQEFMRGDPLLRLDRRLATLLDGVYKPSEFYLRWLERLTALNFGTPLGRLLTLFVTVPFLGAFAFLTIIMIASKPLHPPELPKEVYYPAGIGLGFVLMGVLHSQKVRQRCVQAGKRVQRSLRFLFVDGPLWLVRHLALKKVAASWSFQLCYWYVLKPLVLTCLIWIFLPEDWQNLTVTVMVFLGAMFIINSRPGQAASERLAQLLIHFLELLRAGLIAGLFNLVSELFRRVLHLGEVLLFHVDEWLRFRSGDSQLALIARALLSLLWFPIAYLIRFSLVVLIEPSINPLKFSIGSIAGKLMFPMLVLLAPIVANVFTNYLGTVLGNALTGWVVFWDVPCVAAFIIWEMKENWNLYKANRRQNLGPAVLGRHAGTMSGLLRPGVHSGVVPKLFARLRQSERRAQRTGNWSDVRAHRLALAEVARAVHLFVTREFCELLRLTPGWQQSPQVVRVNLAINQIRVELSYQGLQEPSMSLEFELRGLRLVAGIAACGWLNALSAEQQIVLHNALTILYKLAGVDLIREQIEGQAAGAAASLDQTQPRFGEMPISWEQCVACWQVESNTPPRLLGNGLCLFPASLAARTSTKQGP